MIDKDKTLEQIQEKFGEVFAAESEFFKKIEEFRAIDADWKPENDEEAQIMMPLAQEIDRRINFILRQIMVRYGNMLFI